jgi:hypothetical protein
MKDFRRKQGGVGDKALQLVSATGHGAWNSGSGTMVRNLWDKSFAGPLREIMLRIEAAEPTSMFILSGGSFHNKKVLRTVERGLERKGIKYVVLHDPGSQIDSP